MNVSFKQIIDKLSVYPHVKPGVWVEFEAASNIQAFGMRMLALIAPIVNMKGKALASSE
jgi:hypothetical protein